MYNELAGFPEFVLRRAMAIAIRDADLCADEEVSLPVWFRGQQIVRFKADLIVQSQVIVEVKARPELDPFNKAQVLHYLKATDLEVGLLLNFGRRPQFSPTTTPARALSIYRRWIKTARNPRARESVERSACIRAIRVPLALRRSA